METSAIAEFYQGRSIFVTGATGFMGKVLVEKLLRSCPAIDRLFILIRSLKGKSVESRLQELVNSQVPYTDDSIQYVFNLLNVHRFFFRSLIT